MFITCLVACAGAIFVPVALHGQDRPVRPAPPRTSVAVTTIGPHNIYNGLVTISHAGSKFVGEYREAPGAQYGVRARAAWDSELMGDVSGALFVARGTSSATYSGIGERMHVRRDLVTVGLDLGWEPALARGSWGSLRLPFGPSILWHRLDLSSGGRDAYAAPDELTAPSVSWSDRRWLSYGGYGGMSTTLMMGRHVGFTAEALGRFVFSDDSAWSSQEQKDIQNSTGNRVVIEYRRHPVFLWSSELGLEWRF